MTDIPVSELARELNVTIAILLQRADDIIDRVVREQGIDAARGLTTRMRRLPNQRAETVISPRLADELRSYPGGDASREYVNP